MRVAVVQMNSSSNKAKNIQKALRLVEKAVRNKAKFILLPEVFSYRGLTTKTEDLVSVKETIPGESTRPFMDLAKKKKVHVLLGSVCEAIKGAKKVYSSSVLVDSRGKIKAKYRKMNLFDAVIGKKVLKESRYIAEGQSPVAARVDNFKVGLSICYDLRFPQLYQRYANSGAHILCVPSAFTQKTGKAHWETLLRARAIENLCYVLAPNQIGLDGKKVRAYGHSMIVSPWGEVLARASAGREEIIYSDINMSNLKTSRACLPGFYNIN